MSILFVYLLQVSQERDGKVVDGQCHSLTASHVRLRHKNDPSVPVCGFYEVPTYVHYSIVVSVESRRVMRGFQHYVSVPP